jgi:hypothetical protein
MLPIKLLEQKPKLMKQKLHASGEFLSQQNCKACILTQRRPSDWQQSLMHHYNLLTYAVCK